MHQHQLFTVMTGAVVVAATTLLVAAQTIQQPSRGVTDPGVVTTRQTITPAGIHSVFDGRVFGITFGAADDELWVLTGRGRGGKPQLYKLDWLRNAVRDRWEFDGAPGLQGLVFDPARASPLVGLTAAARGASFRAGGTVQLLAHDGKTFSPLAADLGPRRRSHRTAQPHRVGPDQRLERPVSADTHRRLRAARHRSRR